MALCHTPYNGVPNSQSNPRQTKCVNTAKVSKTRNLARRTLLIA